MNRFLFGLLILVATTCAMGEEVVVLHVQDAAGASFEVATPADQAALVSFDDGQSHYALTPHVGRDGSVTVAIDEVPVRTASLWRHGDDFSLDTLVPVQSLSIANGAEASTSAGFRISARMDDTENLRSQGEKSRRDMLDRAAANGVPVLVAMESRLDASADCPEP